MLGDDDLDAFLEDHGSPCLVAGQSFVGILNQADDGMQLDIGTVQSTMRDLTVKTADVAAFALKVKTTIAVAGVNYEVRGLDQLDDGAFTVLKVRKL